MTIGDILVRGEKTLRRAGVPDPEIDAALLLEAAAQINRSDCFIHRDREIDPDSLHAYLVMLERRASREPLQHIIGTEFMGLPFICDGRALVPRPDTEILAEAAIETVREAMRERRGQEDTKEQKNREDTQEQLRRSDAYRILDLCTGSGCIAVSLAHYLPEAEVTASDLSEAALSLAAENIALNKVKVRTVYSDLLEALRGERFHLIVSNPPYIRTEELEELLPEVRDHDPEMALDGGPDGLDFYRRIAAESADCLTGDGWLYLEIGYDQGAAVRHILEEAGYIRVQVLQDLAGLDRVVCGRKQDA